MSKRWLPVLGAIAGGAIAGAIAWSLAADDIGKLGDWKAGAQRFIGMVTAIGVLGGYVIVRQLVGVRPATRDGFTLSFRRLEPQAEGYRELQLATVGDLGAALVATGYEPQLVQCDDDGTPAGPLEATAPLAGVNLAIRDRGVRGWVRIQLAAPIEGRDRSLGLVEVWSERGESAEELALFALRALDRLLPDLTAARESSQLSGDPAALLTSTLGERPVHRAA